MWKSVSSNLSSIAFVMLGTIASSPAFAESEGAALFGSHCAHCHALVGEDTAFRGPNLQDIVGRTGASVGGYEYSAGLREAARQGLIWDENTLDRFLASPRGLITGTLMGFPGLGSSAERGQLISWLKDVTSDERAAASDSVDPEVANILALQVDPDYGAYLAAECLTCHAADKSEASLPQIFGMPQYYFVKSLLDYKTGQRDNSVMKLMAQALGNEEMAALSSYFSGRKP